jgi:hypothetical protein
MTTTNRNRQNVIDAAFALGGALDAMGRDGTEIGVPYRIQEAAGSVLSAHDALPDGAARSALSTLYGRMSIYEALLRQADAERVCGLDNHEVEQAAESMRAAVQKTLTPAILATLRYVYSLGVDGVDAFSPEVIN